MRRAPRINGGEDDFTVLAFGSYAQIDAALGFRVGDPLQPYASTGEQALLSPAEAASRIKEAVTAQVPVILEK